jgi:hypothetical protein
MTSKAKRGAVHPCNPWRTAKAYPTDVSDDEWSFAAPYLSLMNEGTLQRRYELCEMFNACAGWRGPVHRGECCRPTSRRGNWSTSKHNVG